MAEAASPSPGSERALVAPISSEARRRAASELDHREWLDLRLWLIEVGLRLPGEGSEPARCEELSSLVRSECQLTVCQSGGFI